MDQKRNARTAQPRWQRRVRVTWTNWTFGVWWGRVIDRGHYHIGIDLGPLEVVWTRRRV